MTTMVDQTITALLLETMKRVTGMAPKKKVRDVAVCNWQGKKMGICLCATLRNCCMILRNLTPPFVQGLVNVPIEHHPTLGDIIPDRCLKVM